jgi:hypothetical protein
MSQPTWYAEGVLYEHWLHDSDLKLKALITADTYILPLYTILALTYTIIPP